MSTFARSARSSTAFARARGRRATTRSRAAGRLMQPGFGYPYGLGYQHVPLPLPLVTIRYKRGGTKGLSLRNLGEHKGSPLGST